MVVRVDIRTEQKAGCKSTKSCQYSYYKKENVKANTKVKR